ncbi:MAG: ROK family protein [Planctomycetaceae bacterium]
MSRAAQAVGVDVGGTKVNALRVATGGEVLARAHHPTPADDMEATLAELVGAVREVLTPDVIAVGAGVAGLVEEATGVLRYAPNIAWRDVPVADRLRDAFGLPVAVDNDCATATLAEWRLGAGRGRRNLLYVGVGTGIGGGIVRDGKIDRGAHGFSAEIGHVIVEPGGPRCGCGNQGCWETVASGSAITRDGRAAVTRHAHSLLAELAGGDPDAVTGELVTRAAQRGDPAARGILAEAGTRLGEGIAGLVNVLDPEAVVVGGGAAEAGEAFLGPARAAFARSVEAAAYRPEVPLLDAALGNDGAAIGAALLAMERLA